MKERKRNVGEFLSLLIHSGSNWLPGSGNERSPTGDPGICLQTNSRDVTWKKRVRLNNILRIMGGRKSSDTMDRNEEDNKKPQVYRRKGQCEF